MKRVLSIDFDYFQEVEEATLVNGAYPDPRDLPTGVSAVVWSSHYVSHGKELNAIDVMDDELMTLMDILDNQDKSCKVMIANSHKHIYDFIHEHVSEDEKLLLTNVDMHHDMFDTNKDRVDCGNWVNFLSEEWKDKLGFKWIANPISRSMFGIGKEDMGGDSPMDLIETTLWGIRENQYDMIFLCRSDIWTPPHLDGYFDDLLTQMVGHFDSILCEQGVRHPREYLGLVEQQKAVYGEYFKRRKEHEQEKD